MVTASGTPLSIGRVSLRVNELASVADFYQRVVGLHLHEADGEQITLGNGHAPLLTLIRDASARRASPREAGLFHTAFLLPTRADLGGWLRHAADIGLRLDGAADHLVSEAVYTCTIRKATASKSIAIDRRSSGHGRPVVSPCGTSRSISTASWQRARAPSGQV